jgi:hypothetical protein
MADQCPAQPAIDRTHSASSPEMEAQLRALRLLVCDLLKANQDLREAILKANVEMPMNQQHP